VGRGEPCQTCDRSLAVFASALILFLFYALEKYVDPGLRYAGVLALVRKIGGRRGEPS
jgi:hypothetical protein